jgi:chemosensory pili system protein ChpA (sensor histidine kinase/response regulator)
LAEIKAPAAVETQAQKMSAESEIEATAALVGAESLAADDSGLDASPVAAQSAAAAPQPERPKLVVASVGGEPEAARSTPEDGHDQAGPEESVSGEVETAKPSTPELLQVTPVEDEPEVLKPGSDPEILEIYLEEAEEESQNIARLQQDWLLHPEDENALKNIRRAFHTIKGSGRLVGAMKIGEFAWDFEQLLNRLIDKTIAPGKQIIDAMGKAAQALPELVTELKTSVAPESDINYLRGLARALAEFKAEQIMIEHEQQGRTVESPDDRITDGDETEWRGIGVGGKTQVVPPDKLTAALLEEIEPDTMRVTKGDFDANRVQAEEVGESAPSRGSPNYDDTVLAEPPEIAPAPDGVYEPETANFTVADFDFDMTDSEYTQAIDYTQSPDTDEAAGFEESEVPVSAGTEPAASESIIIETIGEDFLDDNLVDEFDDQSAIEAPSALENDGEVEAVKMSAAEPEPAEDDFEEITMQAPEIEDQIEQEAESAIEIAAAEPEPVEDDFEEITMQAPEIEDQIEQEAESAIEIAAAEREPAEDDFEEITMQAPEIEPGGMTLEASGFDTASEAQAAEAGALQDEAPQQALAPEEPAEASQQETPPDPLADTTNKR